MSKSTDEALKKAALSAMENAYAPYSGFRVGAAIHSMDGKVVPGSNIENSAYGNTICAETLAVCAAVSQGLKHFDLLAIATEADQPTPPCGACRQVLNEFAPEIRITSYTRDGKSASWALSELLPYAFIFDTHVEPGS